MATPKKNPAVILLVTIGGVRRPWWYWLWYIFIFWRRVRMLVQMTTAQRFPLSVQPVDANGKPGTVDSPPTYPSSTPGIVTITVAADGLSCEVAGAAPGSTTIIPMAVAGGATIQGDPIDVTVTAAPLAPAVKLLETIGQVEAQ